MGALVITPELEADAQRLAAATGMTPTEAVADAVRQRLHLVVPVVAETTKPTAEEILLLARSIMAGRQRIMTDDEALGYDDRGLCT